MAVRTKSGFIVRDGRRRRQTVWFQFGLSSNSLAASATAVIAQSLNAAALELRPFTIVRSRFVWRVDSDQSAATETYTGNVGLCVVSDQAVAIGVSAVPTPASDLGSDLFFMIDQWIGKFALIGAEVTQEVSSKRVESKAMRKVDIGQDIVLTKEAGIGGTGCEIATVGLMLVKLH